MYKKIDTMKPFYYVLICHYTVSLMIIIIMIISLLFTIQPIKKQKIYEPFVLNIEDEDDKLIVA